MNDKIAIYLRLSLADGDLKKGSKDESNSIENQRMLLHDYIGKQEDLFGEIVEYVDDGYTGTNDRGFEAGRYKSHHGKGFIPPWS